MRSWCTSILGQTEHKKIIRRMTRFEHHNDFWGTYEGSHDGRRARLMISDTKMDTAWPNFQITLEDLDRGETFRDIHHQKNTPSDGEHVLTNVQLKNDDGSGKKEYRKLLIHTWNTAYLTGISVWNGREFGASFREVNQE